MVHTADWLRRRTSNDEVRGFGKHHETRTAARSSTAIFLETVWEHFGRLREVDGEVDGEVDEEIGRAHV